MSNSDSLEEFNWDEEESGKEKTDPLILDKKEEESKTMKNETKDDFSNKFEIEEVNKSEEDGKLNEKNDFLEEYQMKKVNEIEDDSKVNENLEISKSIFGETNKDRELDEEESEYKELDEGENENLGVSKSIFELQQERN